MSVKKAESKGIKYNGKSRKVKELVKKLNLNSGIQIKPGSGWFENAMKELDKGKK